MLYLIDELSFVYQFVISDRCLGFVTETNNNGHDVFPLLDRIGTKIIVLKQFMVYQKLDNSEFLSKGEFGYSWHHWAYKRYGCITGDNAGFFHIDGDLENAQSQFGQNGHVGDNDDDCRLMI